MTTDQWQRYNNKLTEEAVPIIKMIRMGLIETSMFTHFKGWVDHNGVIDVLTDRATNWTDVSAAVRYFEEISHILDAEREAYLAEQTKQWWDDY